MSNALDIADDSLNTSGKLSIKVSKQIPIEEWNKVSDPGQSITWTVPGGEHLKLKLRFYPKGDAIGEEKVSVWFGGLTKHPDTHVNVALTLGFESPGCPEPCSITQEMAPVDADWSWSWNFMEIGKVPEYIVNDCLVFHAEIVVSFTGPKSLTLGRYFDEDAEKEDVRHGLLQKIKATDEDFTIISEGQRMTCHKVVLAAQSEYFDALFGDLKRAESGNNYNENKSNEVTIDDVGADTVKLLLEYFYTLKVKENLNRDEISELLIVADRFQMKHLVKRCVSILMSLLEESTYIQTFLLIEKTSPKSQAREDLFELMKKKKKIVAKSEDLPDFVQKYPMLATEFLKAVCDD